MEYTIEDEDDRLQDTATITINVVCLRAKPIAKPDPRETDEDEPITIRPLDNDVDPEGDPLTLKEVGQPDIGTIRRIGDTVEYTPSQERCDELAGTRYADGYTATIPYTIEDEDDRLTDDSVMTIDVRCVREAPIARDDEDTTDEDTPTTTPILDNDEDPDDPANRISINEITEDPKYGTITPIGPTVRYDPTGADEKCRKLAKYGKNSFVDTYKYNVIDTNDKLVSNEATVTITVMCNRAPPNANDVYEQTDENTPIDIDVLDNDTDPEGDTDGLTIVDLGQPEDGRGTTELNPDNTVKYTPNDEICDKPPVLGQSSYTAQFEYTIMDSDDELTDTATVYVTVECVIPPIANDDGPITIPEGGEETIPVTNNDYDPDGGDVRINEIVDEPNEGTVTIIDDDNIKYTPDPLCCRRIAPATSITDTFTYNVIDYNDDELVSNEATVTIKIVCDRGEVKANPDEATTNEDEPVTVSPLDNDTDQENDPLQLTDIGQPSPNRGTADINEIPNDDDTVTYTPELCTDSERNRGYYQVVIPYGIEDEDDRQTDDSTITITVVCNQRPTPEDDEAETDEESPVTIDVLDNDTDPEDDNLSVEEITRPPTDGTAQIVDDKIVYTPSQEKCRRVAPDETYTTTLEYNIRDDSTAQLLSDESATVTITVDCKRGQPKAVDDEENTDEDTPVDIEPLANDSDPENDPLQLISVEEPQIGSRTINPDNTVTYTPGSEGQRRCRELAGTNPMFDGYTVTMDYVIEDADDSLQDEATITVNVVCLRAKPIAKPDPRETNEDQPIVISPLDNDEDPENDPLQLVYVGPADIGTAQRNPDDTVTYTPSRKRCDELAGTMYADGYTATIEYTIEDEDDRLRDSSVMTIDIRCVRVPPIAEDDEDVTDQDSTTTTPVLENDEDPDDPANEISINEIVEEPEYGEVTIENGAIKYDPTGADEKCRELAEKYKNYYYDIYKYNVIDTNDRLVSNDATVTIKVRCIRKPPNARDDEEETDENTPIDIEVLENDTDEEGDTDGLTVVNVGQPEDNRGTTELNPDGTVTYTPNDKLCDTPASKGGVLGQASYTAVFEYTIEDSDDNLQDTANVYVVVQCVVPPIAKDDGPITIPEGSEATIPVTNNDYDPDGGNVRIEEVVDEPNEGTVTIVDDNNIKYTPDPLCCRRIAPYTSITDTFTYTVTDYDDDQLISNEATVTIVITCERGEVQANPDEYTTNEDEPIVTDPLENDTDQENDPLQLTGIEQPDQGEATINPVANGDDTVTYEPELCNEEQRSNGQYVVQIPYSIQDEDDQSTDSSTITITVICNQPPEPEDDTATTDEESPVEIPVLNNDSDPENDDISINEITDEPDYGTAEIVDDEIVYTPSQKKCDDIAPKRYYTDELQYNIIDDSTAQLVSEQSATVTIRVECLRGDVRAVPDTATTREDTPVEISPLANDEDDEDDPLQLTDVESPVLGTREINENPTGDDTVTYTPKACNRQQREDGSYQVVMDYSIEDADDGATDSSTITVTVICNKPPTAIDDPNNETDEDSPIEIDVIDNDTDPEDDLKVNKITEQPEYGTAELVPGDDQSIKYTPSNQRCNEICPKDYYYVTFKYTAIEKDTTEQLESNEATVTVRVECNRAAPIARDDEDSTDEDTPVTVYPLENDEDPENDPLTLVSVEDPQPPIGSITVNPDNTVTYTPGEEGRERCRRLAGTNPKFDGYTVTMNYVIEDADDQLQDTATITITVECLRGKPEACDGLTYTTDEDTQIRVEPCGEDPEGGDVTIVDIGPPLYGDIMLGVPGYIYIPDPDRCEENPEMESYTDIIPFTVQDEDDELTDDGEITVIVTCIREGPIAEDDSASVPEDGSVDIAVLENDEDQDNPDDPDAIELNEITDEPNRGTVTMNDDGTITYTPNEGICNTDYNYNKRSVSDSFKYNVRDIDDNLVSNEATVSVTIQCERRGPIAVNDYDETDEDESVTIPVLDNDSDPDGGELSIINVGNPNIGTVTENDDGTITYTPQPGYCSKFYGDSYTAQFTYTISDLEDDRGTASATVEVLVNCDRQRPIARHDEETTNQGVPVTIDILDNDSDPDGGDVELNQVGQPQLGDGATVTVNDDGTVEYTPGDNCDKIAPSTYYTDTFSYTVRDVNDDNLVSNPASVTIRVQCDNRAPMAINDKAKTDEDTPVVIDVLANDSDPEDEPLRIAEIVSEPSNGNVVINDDETVTYTPDANFCGTDSFEYANEDEGGLQAIAVATIVIVCRNDAPSAVDDYGFVPCVGYGNTDVTIDVLANDTDPDSGDTLEVVAGSIKFFGTPKGSVVINSDDTITYTPNEGECGIDTFEYTAMDQNGGTSTAIVTIEVECCPAKPIPPVACDDSAVTYENMAIDIDVLDNDIDADDPSGKPMLEVVTDSPFFGDAWPNDDGTLAYEPYPGICGCTDRLKYRVIDQDGLTDTAEVRITINCNDAPVAIPDYYGTEQDESVNIYPLDNDYDPEGFDLDVIAIPADGMIDPAEGTLDGNVFTPASGFCGQVQFDYVIADPSGKTARSTITIDVRCPPKNTYNNYYTRYEISTGYGGDGYAAHKAPVVNIPKTVIPGFHDTAKMNQYGVYITIAFVTLMFNAFAFFMTYKCCISKVAGKQSKFGTFVEGVKVVDDDDDDDTEIEDEDEDEFLNEDV